MMQHFCTMMTDCSNRWCTASYVCFFY